MFHGLKVSMAKGTAKKRIIQEDESLSATKTVILNWKAAAQSLSQALFANETAWQSVFGSYITLEHVSSSIYSARDTDVRACLHELQGAKARVDSYTDGVEAAVSATQRLEVAKKDLATLVQRLANAEAMNEKRLDLIRQHRYYDGKTNQMLQSEAKSRNPVGPKVIERRTRNQKKVQELATELTSLTTQLHAEMEAIDVERLAITDRCLLAVVTLQKYYFESNPVDAAVKKADEIGLGRRVLIRNDQKPWLPDTQTIPAGATTGVPSNLPHPMENPAFAPPPYNPNAGNHYPPAPPPGAPPTAPSGYSEGYSAYITPPAAPSAPAGAPPPSAPMSIPPPSAPMSVPPQSAPMSVPPPPAPMGVPPPPAAPPQPSYATPPQMSVSPPPPPPPPAPPAANVQ